MLTPESDALISGCLEVLTPPPILEKISGPDGVGLNSLRPFVVLWLEKSENSSRSNRAIGQKTERLGKGKRLQSVKEGL